jgi:hypothetical protein
MNCVENIYIQLYQHKGILTNGMLEILIPCMKLFMPKANVMIVGCCVDITGQYRAFA